MKIVVVVPSLKKSGGLERVVSMIANDLSSYYKLKIVVLSLNGSSSFYELDNNVQVIGFNMPFRFKILKLIPLFIWSVSKIIQIKPDKIVSFGEGHNSFVIAFCLLLNIRNIYVFNRSSPTKSLSGYRGIVNPFFYKYSKYLIVQTNQAKNLLIKKYSKSKIKVIPNPISIVTDTIPMHKKELKILSVGTLGGQKNQSLLIDFYASIHKSYDNWTLHFIGDGPKKSYLVNKAKNLKLSDKIFFHGKIKKVSKFYNTSSIFAFTSLSEGFPNVLAEAMSYGCACISFDCIAGPSDLIDDNHNGFLIKIGNNDEYIQKLDNLIDNDELREKFSQNAILKVNRFKRSDIIADIYDMLKRETIK